MRITVETLVKADLNSVWTAWNDPEQIRQWNAASDDWQTTRSQVDLREGGTFSSRMEAKDGSAGFDFEGIYTRIAAPEIIEYRLDDGREVVVEFIAEPGGTLVRETFDSEPHMDEAPQRRGWKAILENFGRYVEKKGTPGTAGQ